MSILKEMNEFDSYMHELISQHFENHEKEIIELYNLIEILKSFNDIYPKTESNLIMDEVITDLFSSIYLSMKGMYRNAFISLRSALELGVGYLYFLDNNLDYVKWTKNKFSLSWSRLNHDDYGVLKVTYLQLFYNSKNLSSIYDSIIDTCNQSYKVCSEYTHGKYGYMKTNLTTRYVYSKTDYQNFIQSYKEVVISIIILHTIRFNKHVEEIKPEHLEEIEDILKSKDLKEILIDE